MEMLHLSSAKKAACGVLSAVGFHAAFIETMNFRRKREPEFRVGSADELLADNLKAGDVVMFRRTWYKYHIPVALMIKAQQTLFGCEFDHSGVIVMQLGVPYILETTPFRGIVCRPFEERVRNSSSAHIIVIPLVKKKELSVQQTNNLRQHAASLGTHNQHFSNSELYGFLRGVAEHTSRKLLNRAWSTGYYCPNVDLMVNAWRSMSLLVHPPTHHEYGAQLSLKDMHDRQLKFNFGCMSVALSENDVLIRSS